MPPAPVERPYSLMATTLTALSSEVRLELLHVLRTPKALHEIRAVPARLREGENPERPLSRQTITHHLDQLQAAGLVHKTEGTEASAGERYVLNHERLFALVDEMRNLAKLRPQFLQPVAAHGTLVRPNSDAPLLPPPPRLVVAYGRDDGVGFSLAGAPGSRWRLGRGRACEIQLDYDPYLSSENSVIELGRTGYRLQDVPGNKNGTWLNWQRLPKGGSADIACGDVLTVGRTTLVFKS